jgi:hypothetical protein
VARLSTRLFLIAALGAAGCGDQSVSCTAAGCSDGITVWGIPPVKTEYDETVSIEACAEDRCGTERVAGLPDNLFVAVPMPRAPTVEVTVTVRDPAGDVVAEGSVEVDIDINSPNGRDCGPNCRVADVEFKAGRLVSRF